MKLKSKETAACAIFTKSKEIEDKVHELYGATTLPDRVKERLENKRREQEERDRSQQERLEAQRIKREEREAKRREEERLAKIKVKKTILDLGTRFTRLQVAEIAEECKVKNNQLIVEIIKEMIYNKEIYAKYFESTKSIAFDQQTNIEEIDRLMDAYKEWEVGR